MGDVGQPARFSFRPGHIDTDQQHSSSRVVNVLWINRVFWRHKSEPSTLPLAHVKQDSSFTENIRPDQYHKHYRTIMLDFRTWFQVDTVTKLMSMIETKTQGKPYQSPLAAEQNRFPANRSYQSQKKKKKKNCKHTGADAWQNVSPILICWDEKGLCHIVPVIVAGSADEVTAWREISRTLYAFKGN